MSRIGKLPVIIPEGVTVKVENNMIIVEGPLGKLEQPYDTITIKVEGKEVLVTRENDHRDSRSKHGLYRALIQNMVTGVKEGFKKELIISGIGYKVAQQGKVVTLNLGKSHADVVEEIDGIKMNILDHTKVQSGDINKKLEISGISKEKVGQFAAMIRDLKKVEPYHAYGIRYSDEVVIKKVGKKAGKK